MRQADGVVRVLFLKKWMKCASEENPVFFAIAWTDAFVLPSSDIAAFSRMSSITSRRDAP